MAGERLLGKRIYRFDSVTSTNDVARELALKQADEGTAVVADEQTLGRGSRGRKWLSKPGANLLLSVIVRPEVELSRISELSSVAAVALARYLIDCHDLQARIKWPNDVRVNDKKIAGVLIETVPRPLGGPQAAIIGVGLNVNWTDIPAEIAATATSVQLETGRVSDMESVLQGALGSLDLAYGVYRRIGFDAVLAEWKSLECSTGSAVTIASGEGTIQGYAEKVDLDGSLLVRLEDGSVRRVLAAGLIVD